MGKIVNYPEKDITKEIESTENESAGSGSDDKEVLTREEIANAVGTATESTIRLLSQFKKEGNIILQGKRIKLANKTKLEYISEGV